MTLAEKAQRRALAVGAGGLRALALLGVVVGAVGGQPLAPVAAGVVRVDQVAPPAVDDLVVQVARWERPVRRLLAHHARHHVLAQQRELGHAVAGGEPVLHDVEPVVGVGTQQLGVGGDLALGSVQQDLGSRGVALAQVGAQRQVAHLALEALPAAHHQCQAVGGERPLPAGEAVNLHLVALLQGTLRDHVVGGGDGGGDVERRQAAVGGVPVAAR